MLEKPNEERWIIGARADCDIVVDEPEVSGRHCRLTQIAGAYTLEDLGSTNGTFVHGSRITGPTPVDRSDDIRLGVNQPMPWPEHSIEVGRRPKPTAETVGKGKTDALPFQRSRLSTNLPPAKRRKSISKTPLVIAAFSVVVLTAGLLTLRNGGSTGEPPVDESLINRLADHQSPIRCLAIAAAGQKAVSSSDRGDLLYWDVPSAKTQRRFDGQNGNVRSLALSNDGKTIAAGCDNGTTRLWKLETGERLKDLGEPSGDVVGVGFSATALHVITAMADGDIKIWKVADGSLDRRLHNGEPIRSFAIASDALSFVTGGEHGAVRHWRVHAEKPSHEIRGHSGYVQAVAISADSKWAASAGDDATVSLWNLETGKRMVQMNNPTDALPKFNSLAFSLGGTRLAGAAVEGGVCVWSNEDGRILQSFGTSLGPATTVAILPNSIVVVAGFENGEVLQWRMNPPTASERRVVDSVAEKATDRGRRLKDFADRMTEGKKRTEEKSWQAAITCFEAAIRSADPDSLETSLAEDARRRTNDLRRYSEHLSEGEKLAKNDRRVEARRQFALAKAILPDRSEAKDALKKADNAAALKRAFEGPKPKAKLHFEFDAEKGNLLARGLDFAMLMTDKLPPIGLTGSPITWDFTLKLASRLPEIDVWLRVELYRHDDGKLLGGKDTLFNKSLMVHQFLGTTKPDGEWKEGEYEIRLHLVTEDGIQKNIVDPIVFPLMTVRWQKKEVILKPRQVLENNFEVRTGLNLSRGDGFRLRASGTITPAPADFYRDLFDDKTAVQRPSGPEGFRQAVVSNRMKRYWLVVNHLPAPALLWRVEDGKKPDWQPYLEDKRIPPAVIETDGEVMLSINSVTKLPNGRDGQPTLVKDDKYWRPDSGEFRVELLRAEFQSPVKLDQRARALMLVRFMD